MLAIIIEIFRAGYAANEAGNLRKSKFSILPPSSLYQHLFYHTNTVISTWILCDREISINISIFITIIYFFVILVEGFIKTLKLALNILIYIIIKISHIHDFLGHHLVDLYVLSH